MRSCSFEFGSEIQCLCRRSTYFCIFQMSNRVAARRKKRKCHGGLCATSSPQEEHLHQNQGTDSSPGSSSSAQRDCAVLYLNPQTPDCTLLQRFAALSSTETNYECSKAVDKSEEQHEQGKQHTLKAPPSLDSPKDMEKSSLPEVQGSSISSSVESENVLNKSDDKINRLLVAMKKRGAVDTQDRPFKCTHCPWAFKKLCNLQSHLQTHSGLKPHVCDICGKAYSHQGTLQQHKRLHTGERPYGCPFCAKSYVWSSDYRKHIRTHTGEKPYNCATCGKDFIRSSDLRKHERNMHTNDKPYPCARCGRTFNKPLSLQRHERTHLGERPFACPDCGKTFTLASRMVEHQKAHKGVRPYVCAVCSKTFTKSSNLAEHEAIHSGQRPFTCTDCGAAFAAASRLVRHRFMHVEQKPHRCSACSRNFSQLDRLLLHEEQSCAGRIFVCGSCDRAFRGASKLAQHMLTHVPINNLSFMISFQTVGTCVLKKTPPASSSNPRP
uniref:C2H2-type domain-containing protein n=1 Tax=Oryzias latipes TaxID=8090 RepID=A0A3B3HVT5_ORYLA